MIRPVCSAFQFAAAFCSLLSGTFNPEVAGSSPARPTQNHLQIRCFGCYVGRPTRKPGAPLPVKAIVCPSGDQAGASTNGECAVNCRPPPPRALTEYSSQLPLWRSLLNTIEPFLPGN